MQCRHLSREEQLDELELPRTLKRYISESMQDTDMQLSQNNASL